MKQWHYFLLVGWLVRHTHANTQSHTQAHPYTQSHTQELLGSLWTFVRLSAPASHEQLSMLAPCYPTTLPLLPAAIAMLELVHLAGGQASPPQASLRQQQVQQQQAQQQQSQGALPLDADANITQEERVCHRPHWWQAAAVSALAGAGLRPGELALVLGRHFSVRARVCVCLCCVYVSICACIHTCCLLHFTLQAPYSYHTCPSHYTTHPTSAGA